MTVTASATRTYEPANLNQQPGRPWAKRTANFRLVSAIGAIVPIVIAGLLYWYTDVPPLILVTVIYFPLQLAGAVWAAIVLRGRKAAADAVIIVTAIGFTIMSLIVLGSILFTVIARGFEAMSFSFITQNNVYINPSTPLGWGGIGHAILGTAMLVLIASLISVPIGVATAVYITEVRGKAVPYVRFFVQAMSGVPSVVAGLFILVVMILNGVLTQSALAGALALSILMLPTVARTAEEVLKLVPEDLRTGALALGSTRARVVLKVVLPAARTGIITATILGIARIVGETAPLLLTALNNSQTVINPVNDPIAALPTYIFGYVAQPFPASVARAWGAALALLILVGILFALARALGAKKFAKK